MEDLPIINNRMIEAEIADHLNLSLINELIEVLGDEYDALLETFKEDSEGRILSIAEYLNEANSVESKQQVASKITKKAHGFKGSASSIGAYKLYQLCRDMENKSKVLDFGAVSVLLPEIDKEYQKVLEALWTLAKPLTSSKV